jgi:hypothetical protein
MSHSLFSIDRATHLKIVGVALACSTALTLFCLSARPFDPATINVASPAVIKAHTVVVVTDNARAVVR